MANNRPAPVVSTNPDPDTKPDADAPAAAVVATPTVVVRPATRRVRMRGTCDLHYGGRQYFFVAGETIELPAEVADYVTSYGMTYDTN